MENHLNENVLTRFKQIDESENHAEDSKNSSLSSKSGIFKKFWGSNDSIKIRTNTAISFSK